MSAKSGDPKKMFNPRIPTDHESPIRRQRSKTRPTLVDTDRGKSRHETFNLLCQQLLYTFVYRRITRGQLLLIASAEQQTVALRPKINVVRHVPDKWPA